MATDESGLSFPPERPPPQDAPTPWRWPTPTKPEASAPGVNEPARGFDPVASWFNWRMAQVPDLNTLGQEAMDWDIKTQAEPQGPESAKLRASMEGGGPIGLGAPGGFAGILRNPLTKTKVKYEHPVTGEEPTKVFHGTPSVFEEFQVDARGKGGLKGPGIYFTENPEMTTGYAMQGMDPSIPYLIQSVDSAERMYQVALEKRASKIPEIQRLHPNLHEAAMEPWHRWVEEEAARVKQAKENLVLAIEMTGHRTTAAPNVRPAYLDIRKPFDADHDRLDPRELLTIAKKLQTGPRGDSAMDHLVRKLQYHMGRSDPYDPRGWSYTKSPDAPLFYEDLKDWLGGAETNRLLQRMGYDGLVHWGGRVSGGEPHRVWIAFKPEQVISPFQYEAQRPLTPPAATPSPATQAQKVRQ